MAVPAKLKREKMKRGKYLLEEEVGWDGFLTDSQLLSLWIDMYWFDVRYKI